MDFVNQPPRERGDAVHTDAERADLDGIEDFDVRDKRIAGFARGAAVKIVDELHPAAYPGIMGELMAGLAATLELSPDERHDVYYKAFYETFLEETNARFREAQK